MMVRRVLTCLTASWLACGVWLGVTAGLGVARVRPSQTQQLRVLPLLPLARGQLLVSIGDPPAWQPISGAPVTVTLFSGRPAVRKAGRVNAYVGFQSVTRPCPASARGDRSALLTFPGFYAPANEVLAGSPFAPAGGARSGDYAASIPGVVLSGHDQIRACVWLARSQRRRTPPVAQDIPVLNGLLAASVSDVPSAGSGPGAGYTLNAFAPGHGFSYSVATTECGADTPLPPVHVSSGALASASVSLLPAPCATDGSRFTISTGGSVVGVLSYPASNARSMPPAVVALGGCELDPVTATAMADAISYVQADGCSVGRILVAPYQPGLPARDVLEAQVDGGVAQAAPFGTAVDLVVNGGGP
jgi:hypothetical protein